MVEVSSFMGELFISPFSLVIFPSCETLLFKLQSESSQFTSLWCSITLTLEWMPLAAANLTLWWTGWQSPPDSSSRMSHFYLLHPCILPIHIFFREIIQIFCPLKTLGYLSFYCWTVKVHPCTRIVDAIIWHCPDSHLVLDFSTWSLSRIIWLLTWQLQAPRVSIARYKKWKVLVSMPGLRKWHSVTFTMFY